MKRFQLSAIVIALAAVLGGCSSMPTSTSLLNETRTDYRAAQSNPDVARFAPLEMKRADEAMAQADAAAKDRDDEEKVNKLAYLAKQRIALTQEVAKRKLAEASVASSAKERDQLRLDQRTMEADQANARAAQSQMNAAQSRMNADQARAATQAAQGETADANRRTQEAQARAAQLEAQLEAQLAELAAKKTERGLVITLGDVLFGTDRASLSADGMRTAQKLADVLQQNPQRTVLVEGFTDSTGTASYNQALSERRAGSVRNALLGMGVARERVAVRGYGRDYPVASNNSAQDRQLNRRVEIVISDATGSIMHR